MAATQDGDPGDAGGPRETFNPWTVVNLVFHHLAANGLHPVLGGQGDPAVPAAALLRNLGIEPGRNDESVTSPRVQDQLAAVRAAFFGDEPSGADGGTDGVPDPSGRGAG